MKTLNISTLFAIIVFATLFTGCKNSGITSEEKSKIMERSSNTIMPLSTINVLKDSLQLRLISRDLSLKDISSNVMNHLKKRMLSTVNDTLNPGVGIAAPQVGVNVRMVYVQRLDKEGEPFEVFFNPLISEFGDSIKARNEGCLSVPGFMGKVERYQNITIKYIDSTGVYQEEYVEGFTAVIFQHEIDHLYGKLYYDRIPGGFNSLLSHE